MSTNETFARYRVGRLLGRGGMAEVHEASLVGHDGFVRRIALKRVRTEHAGDPELARLFADEARIASHLHHANLVGVLDFGVHEGVTYQALELVEGTTLEALRDHLASSGRAMPEEIALHVVREVAHGLAYAHRATDEHGKALGLVHRDVSPSNVLIGFQGDVKLTDFGIAFARHKRVETAHGVTRGKPSYMAPEQATKGTLDARTDVFALGCTLHFALTGRSPLEGDDVLMKLLVGEPAPLDPTLPEDLRELIASAVSPDRRDRPASAEVFAERVDLAHRARGDRDGRAALRAWLAPLSRELRRDTPTHAAGLAAPSAQPEPPPPPPTDPPRSPALPGGRARQVLIGLGLVGVAVLAIEGSSLLRARRVEDASETGADVVAARTPAAALSDAAREQDATPEAVMEGETAIAMGAGTGAGRGSGTETRTEAGTETGVGTETEGGTEAGTVSEAGAATETGARLRAVGHARPDPQGGPPPEAPHAEGWVRIVAGCPRARDGEVFVDGRRLGEHVPTTTRVLAGRHGIRVDTHSGERFEGTLEVTSFHTEGRPAWFRACE